MSSIVSPTVWEILESEAARINSPAFISADPVQFPRRFSSLPDIEIAAFLSATIAWGNRRMICRNIDKMLAIMCHDPYNFVMDEAYEDIPDGNIHRTFFARDLRYYLRGLHEIYSRWGSLQEFARGKSVAADEFPSWTLVRHLNEVFIEANNGVADSRCLPQNLRTTALKRINMALRWLVRDDGIVDLGVWDVIKPSQLYMPLDVHVGNTARALRLIERKADDRRTAVELTRLLASRRPADPVWFDFALFGIGVGAHYSQNYSHILTL